MRILFETDSPEEAKAAQDFMTWLCEQGEQDYWAWMDCQDNAEVVRIFDYDWKKDEIKCILKSQLDPI